MQLKGISQNSPEWLLARVGCVTASHAGDVMKKLKDIKKEPEKRKKYRRQLIWERFRGISYEHYVTAEMQWGIDHQEEAREAYEIETGRLVSPGGFWLHDRIAMFGASPDYLLGKDGLVEIKCPTSDNHIQHFEDGEIDENYEWQMMAQCAVTGRRYCDYVSFDPRWPEHLQLWIKRFVPDQAVLRGMELEIEHFLEQVEQSATDLDHLPKVVVMK